MNTADKSLSAIDLALRRRFEFTIVSPDATLVPPAYGGVDVRRVFAGMNRRLAAVNGSENLIGHADYMESKLEELRVREGFTNDATGQLAAVAHTMRTKTIPFLVDLFRSDWPQVRFVVGKAFFEEEDLSDLAEALQELGRPEPEGLVTLAQWWNPRSEAWDAVKLRGHLPAPALR